MIDRCLQSCVQLVYRGAAPGHHGHLLLLLLHPLQEADQVLGGDRTFTLLTPLQSHHSIIHHSETELQGRRYDEHIFKGLYP